MKEKYDRYIVTEDDNEFSPNFLQYMNQCLEKYKNDSRIGRICGYSYMEWENIGNYPYNAFPMKAYCAWGVGCWYAKDVNFYNFSKAKDIIYNYELVKKLFSEKLFVTIHRLLFRWKNSGGDLRYVCYCALEGKYGIFPSVSKVRNHGFDGEGLHCASINTYAKQKIDDSHQFLLDDFEIKPYKQITKMHDKHYGGKWYGRLVRFEYWQWKKTGKTFRDYNWIKRIIRTRVRLFLNK